MKAGEFVKQLAAATPGKEALAKAGRSPSSIEHFVKTRACVRRPSPLNIVRVPGSEDLVDLFDGWDLSSVTIGMIQFLDKPVKTPRGLQIGVDEAAPLLIAPIDGEIIVEEEGTGGHRLSEVAENAGKLLDALIVAARFIGERAVGNISYEDLGAAAVAASNCAAAAGGERYLRFYRYLLGADE